MGKLEERGPLGRPKRRQGADTKDDVKNRAVDGVVHSWLGIWKSL